MIIILSPAKTLDYEFEVDANHSVPAFLGQSSKLIKQLKEKEPKDICIPEDTNDEEMIMITVPPKRNMKVYNSSGSFDVVISKSG